MALAIPFLKISPYFTILQKNCLKESVLSAYRHMVFNIIASNQDDHTKNFSFLMDARLIIDHIQTIFYENFEKMARELEIDEKRINRILGHTRRFDV